MSAAGGSDGSDFAYRQTIADRYKTFVTLRKSIKLAAKLQLVLIAARTVWKALPAVVAGSHFSLIDQGIMAGAVALFLIYQFAFAFGKPQRERLWAIQVYCIGTLLLLAECILTFWAYHVLNGALSTDPKTAAAYPPIPKTVVAFLRRALGLSAATAGAVELVLGVAEKALDVVTVVVNGYGGVLTWQYVMEQKLQRSEAEGKRGTKTE